MRQDIVSNTKVVKDRHWIQIGRGYEAFEENGAVYIRDEDKNFAAGGSHEALGAFLIHSASLAGKIAASRDRAAQEIAEDIQKRR